MATRIRTLNFLPEIFKTPTNAQFLRATLDQIVDQPNTRTIQGFVGSKFGYGVDPKDYYVTEPTKTRRDYQLEPGVVFTKPNETIAQDFISYPGIIDAIKLEGGIVDDNNRLFDSQFYSWDSFTNLDKIINFNQYYWLPNGPEAVIVSEGVIFSQENYLVVSGSNSYTFRNNSVEIATANPTITLLRGGSYSFLVNQNSSFWIQGAPGITGNSPIQNNLNTREILGVTNNGATQGLITFDVPLSNAQDEYILPGNNVVDIVCTIPFDQVNGTLLSSLGNIDGITSLDGLTLMFYNTGVDQVENNYFYTIQYHGLIETNPSINLVQNSLIPSEEKISVRYGTQWVGRNFFRNTLGILELIPYLSAPLDTLYYQDGSSPEKVGIIKIVDSNQTNSINVDLDILGKKNYTAGNGVKFTNGLKVAFQGDVIPESYREGDYYVEGVGIAIELIPVESLTAPNSFTQPEYIPYDDLPYDIGNYDSNLGVPGIPDYITIARNAINKNGWSRSNRWFHIDVINATAQYNNNPALISLYANKSNKAVRPIIEFYPNLKLFDSGTQSKPPVDFIDFRSTDALSQVAGQTVYYPDVTAWTSYPGTATINAVTGNFVTTGLSTTLTGNKIACEDVNGFNYGDQVIFTNMKINDIAVSQFGTIQENVTYYINSVINTPAFKGITISQEKFGPIYTQIEVPELEDETSMTVTVTPLSTIITVATEDITNTPAKGQYIADSTFQLPVDSQILTVSGLNTATTTILVGWDSFTTIAGTNNASLSMATTNLENFQLFDGARIVFAADSTIENKIYVAQLSQVSVSPGPGLAPPPPIFTLTLAPDSDILLENQLVVNRGYYNEGKDYFYTLNGWIKAQEKISLNQPPLFDVFDKSGISFGNKQIYSGSSFKGCKLFSYGIGIGPNDPILNFPLKYSSIDNLGDISFDISFNTDTFDYIFNDEPKTLSVNTGYVYNYINRTEFVRNIGWQTAVSPSVQYQLFEYTFDPLTQAPQFELDILPVGAEFTNWPIIQVYVNNNILTDNQYNVSIVNNNTIINITEGLGTIEKSIVQILIISDSVSSNAYYTVPINLTNNPFNEDPTSLNVGDIRGQYQSIFYNNPDSEGEVFGPNNFRDLGNVVPYGNRIIQNSASLVLPGSFLRKQNHNFFNAVEFNSRAYITFKTLLIDVVTNTEYNVYQSPAEMLDEALDEITSIKTETAPFFWSDMIPSKAPFISNTYTFNINFSSGSTYPLNKIYDFKKANYEGVLVYLIRTIDGLSRSTQLIRGVDYIVSETTPSLTVIKPLNAGDKIQINQYNQTYGSYVPNTPTKLGLYPATIPSVVLDENSLVPTYFIKGHDGSYNKLYGSYNPITGVLVDFRDQVLLEFEKRVYNNLKLNAAIPVPETEVIPGFWRETQYTNNEVLQIYSQLFLNWVGQNRIEYQEQLYLNENKFTYNYWESGNKINKQPIQQGNWRGIYQYYFDTTNVNSQPWQMIGYTTQPSWWEDRYGPAPYTSDNLVLWNDLAQGIDYNDGVPVVKPQYVRPELLDVLPVDSAGDLLSPFNAIVGNYAGKLFKRNWKVGDSGPAEFSYRRSSSWPFDLMKILALTKPAKFFNLGVDLDNYKYNEEFNQYLVNERNHLIIDQIQIYGNGIPKTSYINWIVDFEKQLGIDATTNIQSLLYNLDVRLVYRLAGFSDKTLLKFFVEKSVPSSRNASLLIPDESYAVLLYDNQPFDRIIYSGVIIQLTSSGFAVYGNSQTKAYFTTLVPETNGNNDILTIENAKVLIPKDFKDKTTVVPYGYVFKTLQEVSTFLVSYGAYLQTQGMTFNQIENGLEVTWRQMVAEFLYWSQLGWEIGSIVTINPAANNLVINKDSYIVQPLTITNQNFVLNQNLYPIQSKDLSVVREDTLFSLQPLNQGDTVGYGQFNISNFEHGIVFDNVTLFNDTIYNLASGLKQNRIYVRGTKTADWNGTVDTAGFILNQDNIVEWSGSLKYTTGSIVTYKNKYWIALKLIQPNTVFQESDWKETDYNEIQKGLLPNSSTRSFESTLYYDINKANLEVDADLLSFSLIGFRPRDYMAIADLNDVTQVNLYQNIIKNKGTRNAVNALKGIQLPQGGIDYEVYENWAIKSATFGGSLSTNFVELRLRQDLLTGNPSIVALNNGAQTLGAQQEVPIYSLFNYGFPITTNNILPTVPKNTPDRIFMEAGYVNVNDVKLSSYYYSGLSQGTDKYGNIVPLESVYVNDYIWLASYLSNWQILTPQPLSQVLSAKNNLNNTVTITFSQPHNLQQFDIFAIVNFNPQIQGYFIVTIVVDPYNVIINLDLDPTIKSVVGQGIGLKFNSQKCEKPSDINNLNLLPYEFVNTKVWVDTSKNGDWAVYRKNISYDLDNQFEKTNSSTFGSAVAYSTLTGYLIGDAGLGKIYSYIFNTLTNQYQINQEFTFGQSFGSAITYQDDLFAFSEPNTNPRVHLYKFISKNDVGTNVNKLEPFQILTAQQSSTNYGQQVAISGDKNWIYVAAIDLAKIFVYRLSSITNDYELVTDGVDPITLSIPNLDSDDNFGFSLATDYFGETIIVGAPDVNYDNVTENWGKTYIFNRVVQNFIVQNSLTTAFTVSWNLQQPLTVTVNGNVLQSSDYFILNPTTLIVNSALMAGDILSISGIDFRLMQTLTNGKLPRIGVKFGYSLDTNSFANEIIIGAPFELDNSSEGKVYRFTNIGEKYGIITGVRSCNITSTKSILINGFNVTLPIGSANEAALAIVQANIPNVTARANNDNTLTIQLINVELGTAGSKLSLCVIDDSALDELGIEPYIATQEILCPHNVGPTQFGFKVAFNEQGSFVASAPIGTRFSFTSFDFSNDENLNNDTVFDNNATQFIEQSPNAGAVYIFDYLENYNESIHNVGTFVYAQSINDNSLNYGLKPLYGSQLSFNGNTVMVGVPNFLPGEVNGKVNAFTNNSGRPNWSIFREPAATVNIDKIENIQIFSAETNNTLDNLDYFDPLQGKLLGVVRENIDYISSTDPAGYNVLNDDPNSNATIFWGANQVGKIWLNTSNIRFLNYHQNDNVYNSEVWGRVFPGSDVAVYTWIASDVIPIAYQGPGTPFDFANYSSQLVVNASGELTPVYFYWVRNTNIIFTKEGKTLSDTILASYINNPKNSGISYFAPLLPNLYALYNSGTYINANDSVLHIGFSTGESNQVAHNQYDLIRANFPDQFLPGVPELVTESPQGLYDRLLDSMSGVDELGQIVPDPYLPKAVQSGILARPRQSFFMFRYGALQNYFQYINQVLQQFPITEIRNPAGTLLTKVGEINPSTVNRDPEEYNGPVLLQYNTPEYWEYINWWAPGYDNNTKSAIQVPTYSDLSTLNVAPDTIVRVVQNNNGFEETYIYTVENSIGTWLRIGLKNGTIRIKSSIWNYVQNAIGFGDNFFDTVPFDQYPSEETRYILRALNEQILIDELLIYRNRGLITLFEYIQNESLESQNYLPWLNKTSFIDVFHTLRELKPYQVFQSDNQDFLAGYINEVKPYHVVIKEFVYKYTGQEVYAGNITDFDLPAEYNSSVEKFISPQLVNSNPSMQGEYTPDDPIWQTSNYQDWFNNRGLSIVGQNNFAITVTSSFISLNSRIIIVDNASGFPINGVISIGNEKISYAEVDKDRNILSGLFRGVDNTDIQEHVPGEIVYIDLPPVVVLDGGRGYTEPPKVFALIDTEIYPTPLEPAILNAVMNGDQVTAVNVINPGRGYQVKPDIVIDAAIKISFTSSQVNTFTNTIQISSPDLMTGDLIQYKVEPGTEPIGGLKVGQWYYINLLESTPSYIVALYSNYTNALNDIDRVKLYDQGQGDGHSFNLGAKASSVTSAAPVRENNITLRFDRTSYDSDIIDWEAGLFYGSFFAGEYNTILASSSIKLFSKLPPISSILASKGGIPFEIANVSNDQVLSWSPTTRTILGTSSIDDSIEIFSSTGVNAPASTVGFYVGMPIYFNGNPGTTNIQTNVTYYVWSIIDETRFTISANIGDAQPLEMDDGIVGSGGLLGYAGIISNKAIIEVNYPGIRTITNTEANTNYITLPLNVTGSGGTLGLYTGIPVLFTGNVFGGIVDNTPYYVTTVVDNQRFTISKNQLPVMTTATETNSSDNTVIVNSTSGFAKNDPVIFTEIIYSGMSDDFYPDFGGIISGTTYYVAEVVNSTQIKLSSNINGAIFNITSNITSNLDGSAIVTNQKDVLKLITGSGSATINIDNPVSPGQINRQEFTLYNTSEEFVNLEGNLTSTLSLEIAATISTGNIVALSDYETDLDNIYVNMPVRIDGNITGNIDYHGIVANTIYNVTGNGRISFTVSNTFASNNTLLCNSVDTLYIDMPVEFSQQSLGQISLGSRYFIKDIDSNTNEIKLSTIPGGPDLELITQNAIPGTSMLGTGAPYIVLDTPVTDSQIDCIFTNTSPANIIVVGGSFSNNTIVKFTDISSPGIGLDTPYYVRNSTGTDFNLSLSPTGSLINITGSSGTAKVIDITGVDLIQTPTSIANFDVSYILGGYRIIISEPGTGYANTNNIVIPGTELGGNINNNLTINVTEVNSNGGIADYILSGTPNTQPQSYYLKVVSENGFEVYSNPDLTAPVSGINFPFTPFKTTTVIGSDAVSNTITVTDVAEFSLYDPVTFTGYVGDEFAGLFVGKTYYISNIDVLNNSIQISNNPGSAIVEISETLSGLNYTMATEGDYALLQEPFTFNQSIVTYNNRVWICVISNNDDEFIIAKWQEIRSDDRRLNAMDRVKGYYQPQVNMPGKDLGQLFTGVEYPGPQYVGNAFEESASFELDTILENLPFSSGNDPETDYNVVGEPFNSGYGPEELVPGIVSDSMTMIVATRPGTNWPVTEYQNVGYISVSVEFTPTTGDQIVYSFYNLVETPQQVRVSIIDSITGLSTTLVGANDTGIESQYQIDWLNQTITLNSSLFYLSNNDCDKLRIDIYEAGNGDQLVRASTNTDPIRYNELLGWDEIFLNCNYSELLFSGSGAIRTNTEAIQLEVISTNSSINSIFFDDVRNLILNESITFQGNLYGGLTEGTEYYVKTISYVTNSITISESISGPTFILSDGPELGEGPMFMIAEPGSEATWSDPIVYWNGTKLNFGVSRVCFRTDATTNSIICNSTIGLVEGQKITFDDNIFGGIVPNKIYYVRSYVLEGTEFTITETPWDPSSPDPVPPAVSLSTAYGSSFFITNDFTIARQPNQISAKLLLPGKPDPDNPGMLINYEQSKDYITYAIFGETTPIQYGGTIPEIEYYISTGNAGPYLMNNYNGGTNPINAVIEVDGLRLNPNDYIISDVDNTLTFTANAIPTANAIISATTFQFTERQYFNTQSLNGTIANINGIITEQVPYVAQIECLLTDSTSNTITLANTTGLLDDMMIQFKSEVIGNVGNVNTDGTIYYIKDVLPGNQITISSVVGGDEIGLQNANLEIEPTYAFVGGVPTTRISTGIPHELSTNNLVRIDGVSGSVQLNNQLFYVHKISDTIVDLYQFDPENPTQQYNPELGQPNFTITGVSGYTGGGYIWKNKAFSIATTTVTGSSGTNYTIDCSSTSDLVVDTPIIFTAQGTSIGQLTVGGLISGTTYYIRDILPGNTITVSATRNGPVLALTETSGLNVNLSQWEQVDVNRLWVTINGYRVPTSALKLNPDNELSILSTVTTTDNVIITSMVPTSTPNEEVYLLNTSNRGQNSVYRANTITRTWITEPVTLASQTITVNDATRITQSIVQQFTVPTPTDEKVIIQLNGDKDILTQIIVFNKNTDEIIDPQYYSLAIISTAPNIELTVNGESGVSEGDILTITEIEGNLIYVNGEYIKFGSINLETGTLSNLTRGVNGTGVKPILDKYSEVFGILSNNKLSNLNYNLTWNSKVYNQELGDPLQISSTNAANFLNKDIT